MTTATPASPKIEYDAIQEVRFAVVIYGGVSLAIYINGIAQEMLKLVRATAPGGDHEPLLQELRSSEKTYRKLGQLLGDPDRKPHQLAAHLDRLTGPIRTRVVVDVLSGTSAGGINAIFLAKALANNQTLDRLQRLWIQEGDIQALINDVESLKLLNERVLEQRPPQSLLNSHRMYLKLLEALDGMDEAAPPTTPSPLVDKLDLFSTATDIEGLTLPIALADEPVDERRHRSVFHFQYPSLDPVDSTDFKSEDNPFLAFAARCTSAFPFAFEPMALCDIFPIVQTAQRHRDKPYCDPNTDYWNRYYVDYIGGANGHDVPFCNRAFGDGGYLDNKPFTYAVETVLKRHADLLVDRKLVYIEPSPELIRPHPAKSSRPDAIENSLAALLTLPRYETIRQDLEAIIERNRQIAWMTQVVHDVSNELSAPRAGQDPEQWRKTSYEQTIQDYGSGYALYQRLKLSAVTDEWSRRVAQAFGIDPTSAYGTAVRILASEWRDLEYQGEAQRRQFLMDFDVQYRIRRIRHLRQVIHERHQEPPTHVPASMRVEFREELKEIKKRLKTPYLALQQLLDRPLAAADLLEGTRPLVTIADLQLIMMPPGPTSDGAELAKYRYSDERSDRGMRARAHFVLDRDGNRDRITKVSVALAKKYVPVLKEAGDSTAKAFAETTGLKDGAIEARTMVRQAYDRFEAHDSAMFPIAFGTSVGEGEQIDVYRISPVDAVARRDELANRAKLKGTVLGAFGAFLDETWRRNDMLWGRLDGAERLISILLPDKDPETAALRTKLIDEAHEEIVIEFLELGDEARASWRLKLRDYLRDKVRQEPEPALVARTAARSTAVTGKLLEDLAEKRRWSGKPFGRVALLGRFAWEFVEVSVPRTWKELFGTYWLQLLLLFAFFVVVCGLYIGAMHAEWTVLWFGGSVFALFSALYVARYLLRRYLTGHDTLPESAPLFLSIGATALLLLLIVNPLRVAPALAVVFDSARELSLEDWITGLLIASSITTLVTLVWTTRLGAAATRRASAAGGGAAQAQNPSRLQFARTWADLQKAVGLPGHVVRHDVRRTISVDFGLVAAYAVWFVSAGTLLVLNDLWPGWIVALGGAVAGGCDFVENRRMLALLRMPHNDTMVAEPLPFAPFAPALGKWLSLVCAVVAGAAALFMG